MVERDRDVPANGRDDQSTILSGVADCAAALYAQRGKQLTLITALKCHGATRLLLPHRVRTCMHCRKAKALLRLLFRPANCGCGESDTREMALNFYYCFIIRDSVWFLLYGRGIVSGGYFRCVT